MRKTDAEFICQALRDNAHTRLAHEDPRLSTMEETREVKLVPVVAAHVYRKYSAEKPDHLQHVLVRAKDREPEVRLYRHNDRDEAWCRFVRQHDGHWYGALCEGTEWMPLP